VLGQIKGRSLKSDFVSGAFLITNRIFRNPVSPPVATTHLRLEPGKDSCSRILIDKLSAPLALDDNPSFRSSVCRPQSQSGIPAAA